MIKKTLKRAQILLPSLFFLDVLTTYFALKNFVYLYEKGIVTKFLIDMFGLASGLILFWTIKTIIILVAADFAYYLYKRIKKKENKNYFVGFITLILLFGVLITTWVILSNLYYIFKYI